MLFGVDKDKKNITIKDNKTIYESSIEGKIVSKIPYVGAVLMFVQKPIVLLILIGIALVIGTVIYLIARKLDLRDMAKMEELERLKKENDSQEKL